MTFGLITEGASEHKIIKHIITKFFKESDPFIIQIQPKLSDNFKQENVGGWVKVLKYCQRPELNDIFIENDYVVIQIDSDLSPTAPFSVSHDNPQNISKLYNDVIQKLKSLILPEILKKYDSKLFFAICIHSIECWLLPIYYTNHHKSDTKTCIATLNDALRKNDIHVLPLSGKNDANSQKTYQIVLSNWKRKQDLIAASNHNLGFKKFITSIETINNEE